MIIIMCDFCKEEIKSTINSVPEVVINIGGNKTIYHLHDKCINKSISFLGIPSNEDLENDNNNEKQIVVTKKTINSDRDKGLSDDDFYFEEDEVRDRDVILRKMDEAAKKARKNKKMDEDSKIAYFLSGQGNLFENEI